MTEIIEKDGDGRTEELKDNEEEKKKIPSLRGMAGHAQLRPIEDSVEDFD